MSASKEFSLFDNHYIIFLVSGLLILNIFLSAPDLVSGSVPSRIDFHKEISGNISTKYSVYCPSGSIRMDIYIENDTNHDDVLSFDMFVDDTQVMNGSRFGLKFNEDELIFHKGITITGTSNNTHYGSYSMPWGEREIYPDIYNRMDINLTTRYDVNSSYTLEVRMFDEGAAFRYKLNNGTRTGSVSVIGDLTRYRFKKDHQCLVQYGMEKPYSNKKISTMGSNCMSPLTLEVDEKIFISFHEAYVDSYCRTHLSGVPGSEEISVSMHSSVSKNLPFNTPWRTIVVGNSWGELPQNGHIHQALCPETEISNTSWIVTGKAFRDCSLSTQGSKDIIDFCYNHSMQYVHLDAGWYGNEWSNADPRTVSRSVLNLTEVIKYGKERGIGVILYINKRAFSYGTKSILDTYDTWGIKGIKLGFVDGLSSGGINQIMNIVKEASKRELIVNIHDNYRPTGMSRTYPNLLTQEGVRGNEQYPTAGENTYLPYTRAVAGPMDYTPMLSTKGTQTTLVHQLSIPYVLYSPLTYLYWYQKPIHLNGSKDVLAWDLLPGSWNESISFCGGPGYGSTNARRSNDTWVLSSMNGPKAKILDMIPYFLENGTIYNATFFRDINDSIQRNYHSIDDKIRLGERMLEGGGSVIVFRKTNSSDISKLTPYPPWAHELKGNILETNSNHSLELIVRNSWNISNYTISPQSNRIGFDPFSGHLWIKPDYRDVGNITVSLRVNLSDGSILWSNSTFRIIDTNMHPRIGTPPEHTFYEDKESVIQLNATDPETESSNLNWTVSTNASFLSHDILTNIWRGIPRNEDVGTYWMDIGVSDGDGGSDRLNLSIEVVDTNDNPVITSGNPPEAVEETHYIFVFTAKDPDPGNDTLKWNMTTDASFLTLDENTGVLKGFPDDPDVGNHSVSILVSDGRGGTDTMNFTMGVQPVNDPPLIEKTYLPDIIEDDPFVFQFNTIDPDDDNFFWELHSNASFLEINGSSGRISGIPGDTSGGSYFVNVSVKDSSGGQNFLNLSLNVTGINDIPVILGSGEINLVEDSPFIFRFEVSDPDQDPSESFNWNLSGPSFLNIENRTGRIFGIPRNDDVGSHVIVIQVKDSEGGFSSRTIICNVQNSNDPPMIIGEFEEMISIMEDNDFTLDLEAFDMDPTADQLHWEIDKGPWQLISNHSGARFEWTPGNDDVGDHHVMISVHDGNGGYDPIEFDLRVVNINDPPKIIEDYKSNIWIIEDYTFRLELEAIDIDPTGDELFWKIVEGPLNLSINNSLSTLEWTPVNDDVGDHHVIISVHDGRGGYDQLEFDLMVLDKNDPPSILTEEITEIYEDVPFSFQMLGYDQDPVEQYLKWSLGLPILPFLHLDPHTGKLSGTPTQSHTGDHLQKIILTDGNGASDSVIIDICVLPVNDPPVSMFDEKEITIFEDEFEVFGIREIFFDPDDYKLNISDSSKYMIDIINDGYNFTLKIKENWNGRTVFILTVGDGEFSASVTMTVTVLPVNDPPEIVSYYKERYDDGSYLFKGEASDIEDGNQLSYTWLSDLDGLLGYGEELNSSLSSGKHQITLKVKDNDGGSSYLTFELEVPYIIPEKSENNSPGIPETHAAIPIVMIILGIVIYLLVNRLKGEKNYQQ